MQMDFLHMDIADAPLKSSISTVCTREKVKERQSRALVNIGPYNTHMSMEAEHVSDKNFISAIYVTLQLYCLIILRDIKLYTNRTSVMYVNKAQQGLIITGHINLYILVKNRTSVMYVTTELQPLDI